MDQKRLQAKLPISRRQQIHRAGPAWTQVWRSMRAIFAWCSLRRASLKSWKRGPSASSNSWRQERVPAMAWSSSALRWSRHRARSEGAQFTNSYHAARIASIRSSRGTEHLVENLGAAGFGHAPKRNPQTDVEFFQRRLHVRQCDIGFRGYVILTQFLDLPLAHADER